MIYKLKTSADFWDWSINVVAPALNAAKYGFISDNVSILICHVTFRQIRVKISKINILQVFFYN